MDRNDGKRLRRELERASRRARRRRYPAALRQRAVHYARLRQGQGAVRREIAAELGLNPRTLSNWLDGRGRFCAVEVIDDRTAATTVSSSRATRLVVLTPRGLRIEGLDLDAVAALVARVG